MCVYMHMRERELEIDLKNKNKKNEFENTKINIFRRQLLFVFSFCYICIQ